MIISQLKIFISYLKAYRNAELLVFAGLLGLAATFQGVFKFCWRKYIFGPSRKVEFDIVNYLFGHFLKLDSSFYQKLKIGDLLSRATNDIRSVRDFLGLGLLVLADYFVVIISKNLKRRLKSLKAANGIN
jgi:ATP-binding cassette, subfamily B, multidrug efflux pump